MIGCDHCEEWYHGDCINVTQRESKYIKKFYCKECREKNPTLEVVYKSKYADKVREIKLQKERDEKERKKHKEEDKGEKSKPKLPTIPKIPKKENKDDVNKKDHKEELVKREHKHDKEEKKERKEKPVEDKERKERVKLDRDDKEKLKDKKEDKKGKPKDEKEERKDQFKDKKDDKKEFLKEDKEEKKHKHKHKHKDREIEKIKKKHKEKHKHRDKSDDELDAKKRKNEKSRDDKEQEHDKEKQKEKEKLQKERDDKEKERLKEKERDLEKQKQLEVQKQREREREERRKKEAEEQSRKEEGAERNRSVSTDSRSKSLDSHSEMSPATHLKRPVLSERQQLKELEKYSEDDDEWQPSSSRQGAGKEKQATKRKDRKGSKDGSLHSKAKRRRTWRESGYNNYSSDEDGGAEPADLTPRHCFGPNCVNCARVGSKYCSDQCGLSLASHRIYQTLPERIREWNLTTCKAEGNNRKELDRIRAELQEVRQRLEELNRDVASLEAIIAKGRTLTVIAKDDSDSSDEEEETGGGGFIDCITCGKEVASRTAIKHMETCFNKFESQTSFGSLYKTKIEGYQMFCDFYNQHTGTYCKRLRVICPEHTKDEKIGDNVVCGFPMTKDVFSLNGEFCRVAKRECNAHYCWEKLRRAELDMDRVRQWLKIDELFEQERQEKDIISRRAGVLGLMLHSTFNHQLLDERYKAQRREQQKQQQILQQQAQLLQQKASQVRQKVSNNYKSSAKRL